MIRLKPMVNKALRSTFSRMIDGDTREWPPRCLMFTYQPQRPKSICNPNKTSDAVKSKRNER